jgi:hypothetical protein
MAASREEEEVYSMVPYFKAILKECDENSRDFAMAVARDGRMLGEISKITLDPGQVLLVEARNGMQRRYWHQWANIRGYTNHVAVKTGWFEENSIYRCSNCGTFTYSDDMETMNDYSDLSPGMIIGQIVRCPAFVQYGDDDDDSVEPCGSCVDYDDYGDSPVKHFPTSNAVYITNSPLPRFRRGVVKKHRRKSTAEASKLTEINFPFSPRHSISYKLLSTCDDIS